MSDIDDKEHPLITDLDYRDKDKKRIHKAALWFERDVFQNLIDEKDEDADLDKLVEDYKKKGASIIGEDKIHKNADSKVVKNPEEESNPMNGTLQDVSTSDEDTTDSDSDSDADSNYDVSKYHVPVNNAKKDGFEIVKEASGNITF